MADGEGLCGYTERGEYVTTHRIRSRDGVMSADVLTLGARLHDFRHGTTSLVARYSTLGQVTGDTSYLNAVAGRVANRIKHGRITAYPPDKFGHVQLELNDNGNHTLHGGMLSWDRRLFGVDLLSDSSITLSMLSVDGDNGFPSNVLVSVMYAFVAGAVADGSGSNRLVVSLTTRNVGRVATITNMTVSCFIRIITNPFPHVWYCKPQHTRIRTYKTYYIDHDCIISLTTSLGILNPYLPHVLQNHNTKHRHLTTRTVAHLL